MYCTQGLIALCASCILLSSTPVWGQRNEPSERDIRKAEQHYKNARKYQSQKSYQQAAEEYLKSYEIYPAPDLLYNAAQVYRLAGDHQQALRYYREYVKLDPTGSRVKKSKQYIDQLIHEIPEESKQPAADTAASVATPAISSGSSGSSGSSEPSTAREPATKPTPAEQPAEPTASKQPPASAETPKNLLQPRVTAANIDRSGNRNLRIAGYISLGAGALALGLGAKYYFDVRGLEGDIENTNSWGSGHLGKLDEGERAELKMGIATVVGVAGIATGATLWLLGRQGSFGNEEEPAAVAPLLTPDTVGVTLAGRL
ncbi:MAG: tetratricopeptide repeat protein [Proteobacteria bacterium]|nr:tetratricopeptide repeat protein [Pseudomonadota bacterium]